ncbi:MAG TPA: glycosyltransferase [Solirubrobacterales bacterium]|nr:glycosyltransferase [Solirubrobacterales bacterium]
MTNGPSAQTEAAEPLVSVVIPCLNEAESIEACVRAARSVLAESGIPGEVIVADNDSEDGSGELATRAGATVVHESRRGYGSAYLAGFAAARGRYIITADADQTYDFGEIPRFVEQLEAGADMVIGNRMNNILPGAMPWLHRYIGNPVLSGFLNLLYRSGIHDAHCGMRALRRDKLPVLRLRSTGMEFASEMVVRAVKEKLTVTEFDIDYRPRTGDSKLSSFRDGWRHLKLLLVNSPTALFMVPGLLMLALGLIGIVLSLAGVSLFGREWQIHAAIASALLTVIGAQVVSLALSARAFAVDALGERPDRLLAWGRRHLTMEHGLALGAIVLLVGLAIGGAIVITWIDRGFGELSEDRLLVFAAVLIILGIQTIFSSFFLSIIGLAGNANAPNWPSAELAASRSPAASELPDGDYLPRVDQP